MYSLTSNWPRMQIKRLKAEDIANIGTNCKKTRLRKVRK